MKHPVCFGYQIATPEVNYSPDLTCLYGDLEKNIRLLHDIGYTAAEFMTVDPKRLNALQIREWLEKYNLRGVMTCTGEVFGTLGLSFLHPDEDKRRQAIEHVKEIINFASVIGGNINIGRVRGQKAGMNLDLAEKAFTEICDYAAPLNVDVLIEPIERAEEDYINTVAEGAELKKLNKDNLKVMMDYCAMSFEEKNICETVKAFVPNTVSHVHLSEPDRWYPGHTAIKPFDSFLCQLAESQYCGPFVIEVLPLPDQKTAAEMSFEMIAPLIGKYF